MDEHDGQDGQLGPEALTATEAASQADQPGFLVAGLFEYNFGDSEVAMLAYAVMALAFATSRASKGSWRLLTVPGL